MMNELIRRVVSGIYPSLFPSVPFLRASIEPTEDNGDGGGNKLEDVVGVSAGAGSAAPSITYWAMAPNERLEVAEVRLQVSWTLCRRWYCPCTSVIQVQVCLFSFSTVIM